MSSGVSLFDHNRTQIFRRENLIHDIETDLRLIQSSKNRLLIDGLTKGLRAKCLFESPLDMSLLSTQRFSQHIDAENRRLQTLSKKISHIVQQERAQRAQLHPLHILALAVLIHGVGVLIFYSLSASPLR